MSHNNVEVNEIEGYPLFIDVEDRDLRIRNQGVSLRNMAVAGRSKHESGKIKASTGALLLQYLSHVSPKDKREVVAAFMEHLKADGFSISVGG